MTSTEIPHDHPRRVSLEIRHRIIEGHRASVVATAGLLAHGRGEAFDYLIGERTTEVARIASQVAVAHMLLAKHPVISVNGNACSLVARDLVTLSNLTGAPLEVNLFYYSPEREDAIVHALREAGASEVLGTRDRPSVTIPELSSNRRKVDPEGIGGADVVLVPLEDGDRTEALRRVGKMVLAIDLNPMSRTSVHANVTVVDNIVRALPLMVEFARDLSNADTSTLRRITTHFDNAENLRESVDIMLQHLQEWALSLHTQSGETLRSREVQTR
ncbi:MAG: phosphopantothenate/pantothenate synthetase [Candidatus Thorarchaeota archaeon]|nr:phosphopantothenate/pantothenate synthetase [Candidatus Thorarchaeota archaeon]